MNVGNPFSTRHTRPGRLTSLDGASGVVDDDRLLRRLGRLGGSATIVGPHGTGKSTLLVHLADAMERSGMPVARIRLRSWRDALRLLWLVCGAARTSTICVDSWECAAGPAGSLVRAAARLRGCRLLVTSHRRAGWPVLVRCRPSCTVLESLVSQLPGHDEWYGRIIVATDIHEAYRRHGGNIREALFDLYDRFEARHRRLERVRL